MRYTSFKIENFKGIENSFIDLTPEGSGIFTLIGLNESGKTTILEALANFGVDDDRTEVLFAQLNQPSVRLKFIPKHKKANFTDKITITAKLQFSKNEKAAFISEFSKENKCQVLESSVPNVIEYTRWYAYENSEYKDLGNILAFNIKLKCEDEEDFKFIGDSHPLWDAAAKAVRARFPKIIYFPTFIFTFPERILLNPKLKAETPVNAIYRKVIEDVAAALPSPVNIQQHIVDRMLAGSSAPGTVTFPDSEKQQAVFSTLEQMSYHISQTIFTEWKKVLGVEYKRREVILRPAVELVDGDRQVYLQFSLREGGSVFDIGERSLGFRWFFSFLLFTLYRARANLRGSTLFLLDEPASNLHPKAQMQLLSSLSKVAGSRNNIIYSTHSHYMVNPDWLEQAFVVSNSAIEKSEDDSFNMLMENPPQVSLEKYRTFVGNNPDKLTYFQAVLDRLDFSPSKLEFDKPSVLVEGKGDYIILEYIKRIIMSDFDPPFIVPTRGASAMSELISLFLGWAVPFCIVLDDDNEGRKAKEKYVRDWGMPEKKVMTYRDIDEALKGYKLENLLEESDLDIIKTHYGIESKPDKDQIRWFFSEMLASKVNISLSTEVITRVKDFMIAVRAAIYPI